MNTQNHRLQTPSLTRRFTHLALAALPLVLCANAGAAEALVRAVDLDKLPKERRLLMGNFVVEFQEAYVSTKKGFSILGLGGSKQTTATNSVTLPDPRVLAELTNFAYASTLRKLRAQGWDIVEPPGFKPQSRDAAKALAESAPVKNAMGFENIDGTSNLYAPTDFPGYVVFGGGCDHTIGQQTAHLNLFARIGSTGSTLSRGASAAVQDVNERKLAKGEALPLLKVWLTVGFGEAQAKGAGSMIAGRQANYVTGTETTTMANAANSKATAGMFLKPEVTRFSIQLPPEGDPSFIGFSRSCGTSMFNAFKPPVDGEVRLHLAEKLYDDGAEVVSLSAQAGDIKVTDQAMGNHLVQRTVKEEAGAGTGAAAGSGNVQVANTGSTTTGRLYGNGIGDVLNTQQTWVSTIRADYYATSALNMMDTAIQTFVKRLSDAAAPAQRAP